MHGSWLFGAMSALVSLVGLFYFVRILWPRIRALAGPSTDADARTRALLNRRTVQQETEAAASDATFRIVGAAAADDGVVVLFVNEGGPAVDLAVEAPDCESARIEPTALLERGQTGHVRLTPSAGVPEAVNFEIAYTDAEGFHRERRYTYEIASGAVSEVAW